MESHAKQPPCPSIIRLKLDQVDRSKILFPDPPPIVKKTVWWNTVEQSRQRNKPFALLNTPRNVAGGGYTFCLCVHRTAQPASHRYVRWFSIFPASSPLYVKSITLLCCTRYFWAWTRTKIKRRVKSCPICGLMRVVCKLLPIWGDWPQLSRDPSWSSKKPFIVLYMYWLLPLLERQEQIPLVYR